MSAAEPFAASSQSRTIGAVPRGFARLRDRLPGISPTEATFARRGFTASGSRPICRFRAGHAVSKPRIINRACTTRADGTKREKWRGHWTGCS
jgi:hypothetical protein